ncbi:hypothetical protein CDAR_112731 [Caerostris darwini]|uniref:Transposase n=1 Tax=Caerostris darwini TaxID=1538125 RepID=A0AAV4Q1H5_9ARAC|nr:hypothetical protein CDAR_112731 [Caerostris darwini]
MLADNLNVDHSTIVRRLGKLWKLAGWALHEFSENNKAERKKSNNRIVFYHDNTHPHVESHVVEHIANKCWELLPHPPYSPTEAPTHYQVNRSLKNWPANKVYDDFDDLVLDVRAWIASKNREFFAHGINQQIFQIFTTVPKK